MIANRHIKIEGRTYLKNPIVDRYQIPINELGDLRMCDIPAHSHIEVLGLPEVPNTFENELYGVNGGEDGEAEFLSLYGGACFRTSADEASALAKRLRRALPPDVDPYVEDFRPPFEVTIRLRDPDPFVHLFFSVNFEKAPHTLIRDALNPLIEVYRRLERPDSHVFICHASEDKPVARELATAIAKLGAQVWFDEWEIRVGESIVQRINDALGVVSHLVVLLSCNSVDKPWVKKELSSALMRQLASRQMLVLPLRLDDCVVPPILADIKYADARMGLSSALEEIEKAIFLQSEPATGAQSIIPPDAAR